MSRSIHYCECGDEIFNTMEMCRKCNEKENPETELQQKDERIMELEKQKHLSDQAASDNADWLNNLIKDLARFLNCEPKASSVLQAVSQLKEDNERLREDLLAEGLSERDYACIQLKIPKTGKPWLDDLIKESLRNEFAAHAMNHEQCYDNWRAERAYEVADKMLAQKGE